MTDVTQLNSPVDAQGWAGVQAAARANPCVLAELQRSTGPTDSEQNLEAAAGRSDLVIAGSFLLTEAVAVVAPRHPAVRFVLVDPLAIASPTANLVVITFREDQAAFLAGALAAMVTHSRILGGVYGLDSGAMTRYRHGFERGAAFIDPAIRVLGAYQGATDGPPFGNASWGDERARQFIDRGADVIFGAGGTTGQGALPAAARAGRLCIGAGIDDYLSDAPARSCLLTSAVTHAGVAVETVVLEVVAGRWVPGLRRLGLAEGAVGLAPFHEFEARVTPEMRRHLSELQTALAAGTGPAGLLDKN
ncbi:MAG: BMP family ABC transporter substrate-binding protein [Candidatus Dormibacteraeota bacterium]|nr:BMP family ABC transporter substrate-binding protein [Candidatus Dormibacteraeota bacterium]